MFVQEDEKTLIPYQNNETLNSDWLQKIKINLLPTDLEKIPLSGSFVTITNRPIGIIEELILAHFLHKIRPEFCFLQNQNLASICEFYEKSLENNYLYNFNNLVEHDKGIGLFPVGNYSSFKAKGNTLSDSVWDKSIIKRIYDTNIKIIPIYITIDNEAFIKMQHLFINNPFSLELIKSIIESTGLEVTIRIGKPIIKNKFEFKSANQFSRFLRAKLYGLGSKLKIDYFYKSAEDTKEIIKPIDTEALHAELLSISDTNKIGEQGNFDIFLTKAKKIPLAIKEIGRLREITFRNIGEGTNNHLDLDEYDLHYLHLFIYDRDNKKIAGAYRLGDGKYIMETIGKKGFYIQSLFKISNKFNQYLSSSLELGRSFVTEEYQNQRLPLFLLWQGITYYISNSEYLKYIIGPVSISSSYSKISRSFIVSYIMKNHWDFDLAELVKPKTAFKPDFENVDFEVLLDSTGKSLKLLDDIIDDIDPLHNRIPVLLKKYFSKQAKIIGFNLDPNFNDALDGFMLTNINNIELENLNAFKTLNKNNYVD